MFKITADATTNNRDQDYRNATIALTSWYIINNLRTKTPIIDPVLAKIYFDTYYIPIGENIENIKEASNEYEPDIIRFFLLNQRQRCCDIFRNIQAIFNAGNIVLPIQCKPFFEEMVTMSENLGQHNIQTKETQVLDSLRDTIIANSLENQKSGYYRTYGISIPEPIQTRTSGKYILTDGEKSAYLMMLNRAITNLYMPMFSGVSPTYVPNIYAMTDLYEDSGTRFAKVIEYIKSALFMICITYDERLGYAPWTTSSVPSVQDDMYGIIERLASRCRILEGYYDSVKKECSRYGGLTIPQAICLPMNTTAHLDCFKPEQNAISPTFKFLTCQAYLNLLNYQPEGEPNA